MSTTVGSFRSVVASRSLCMTSWRTLRALEFALNVACRTFFDNSTDSLNSSNFFEPLNVSPPT